jgi:hypothetical protein
MFEREAARSGTLDSYIAEQQQAGATPGNSLPGGLVFSHDRSD